AGQTSEAGETAIGGGNSGRTPVLVGYGPRAEGGRRERRRHRPEPSPRFRSGAVLAKPPVRKLARDLGVDLAVVPGTGPAGSITRDDVARAAEAERGAGGGRRLATPNRPMTPSPADHRLRPQAHPPSQADDGAGDLSTDGAGGPVGPAPSPASGARVAPADRRIPIAGVRRMTAQAMVASAFTAPHVTEFLQVDGTSTMELRDRLAVLPDFADVKVTPLLLVARALLIAARRHPMVNSSWDEPADEIVVHGPVNLGIAVASPRGLVVPNIPDAGALTLPELARALHDLVATARDGRTTPTAMRGGTITITNIGGLGVDTGTPILNPGEAAILALGSIRPMPWVHEGALAVRSVAQLAISIDHRIIDGALASAVLSEVGRMVADPTLMLAWS
ncbi:MAG: dihydrolipoamide acetyltransferase family protein, partial [Frankia sp.]